jgi:predicted DCC family thiol-disulfide oxidoreductase YuxK
MALSFAVAIGWQARRAAGGLVALAAYLLFQGFYANHLYLLALVLLLVALSDCERQYAIRPRGSGPVPGWPLFLMRAQLSIVYLFAGIAKINGEFLSGSTLGYHFENSVLPVPDFSSLLLFLSLATVAAEIFIGLAVWSERLRSFAFALVLPLHAVMPFVSQDPAQVVGILIFTVIMLVLFASFLNVPEGGRLVIWDDRSEVWRRRVSFLRKVDLFGALRFARRSEERRYEAFGKQPGESEAALHLFLPGWRIRAGMDAILEIIAVLPGGCFIAPYLALPGVRVFGSGLTREKSVPFSRVRPEPTARPV